MKDQDWCKVYVVTFGSYSDEFIAGAFKSEAAAVAYCEDGVRARIDRWIGRVYRVGKPVGKAWDPFPQRRLGAEYPNGNAYADDAKPVLTWEEWDED